MNLNWRTVVVIGARSGIGRAVAVAAANAVLFDLTTPFLTAITLHAHSPPAGTWRPNGA